MQHDAAPHIDEDWHEIRCAGDAESTKSASLRSGSGATTADHHPLQYENWTREQLAEKARELGLDERTKMTKPQLEQALLDATQ